MIEAKMPWLAGDPYFIQQDGARPHTANGTIEDLVAGGTGEGFTPVIVTQPPNSPDLNINDLGFFASLKVDVKRICTHCTSRDEMMANVVKAFEEYPSIHTVEIFCDAKCSMFYVTMFYVPCFMFHFFGTSSFAWRRYRRKFCDAKRSMRAVTM